MRSRGVQRSFALFLSLLGLYAAVFAVWRVRPRAVGGVVLSAAKEEHYHYDIVELTLASDDPAFDAAYATATPHFVVMRGSGTVTTIAGIREMTSRRISPGRWTARWPVPWNAPAGQYRPALQGRPQLVGRPELVAKVRAVPFKILRRVPQKIRNGLVVATLESVTPLSSMRVKGPDGKETDWTGLLDWTKALGADAFWMLGGQTPGLGPGEIWMRANLDMIPKVAEEAHKRGLKFGVYAMFSLTMSKKPLPFYRYGEEIKDGRAEPTRAISIGDHRRLEDVAAFLKPYAADPNVDWVGLDYIRNALGGYELVDEFVAEMPGVVVPPEWRKLAREERMTWLARKKIMRRDMEFVDAWQWWRARRVALIVKEIKARLGGKALWAFTLTWDKGWHHGQDPVMMNDAGVDIDALMFYEADKPQYAAMVKSWNQYIRRSDAQVLPGNIFDWGLHQKDPEGPKEFGRRLRLAVDEVYADGPAPGIFYHDLARLLWGRLGPWGTKPWAEEAAALSRYVKDKNTEKK